jgi:hypothetical protein
VEEERDRMTIVSTSASRSADACYRGVKRMAEVTWIAEICSVPPEARAALIQRPLPESLLRSPADCR